ncbi:sporulation protein [Streptomyces globosus]|uniref:sporulation protein n=1 Tax=Streptomyces globosus TaxID=68209 RepID=UPI0031D1BAE7
MAFRKLLSALGVGAPEVETEPDRTRYLPGEEVTGTITLRGGAADAEIERLTAELVVRFESHLTESTYLHPVARRELTGPFTLRAGEVRTERLSLPLPLAVPLTHAGGRPLKGAYCAIRTELAVDKAVDRGDLDEMEVHALPSQAAVLGAFEALGFRFDEAEVKPGIALGSRQDVDWWQEIELSAPPGYGLDTVELLLAVLPDEIDVRPGTTVAPLTLRHEETADHAALTARLEAHLRSVFPPR